MITRLVLLGLCTMLSVYVSGCSTASTSPQPPTAKKSHEGYSIQQRQVHVATKEAPSFVDGNESDVRKPKPLTLSELRRKYRSHFIMQGPSDQRRVALTFDDVPDNHFTPQVLDVLRQYGVKATFFVVGNRAEKYPDILKRILDEGHIIGNHCYDHANLPNLSDEAFHNEINRTQDILRAATGHTVTFIRPPYGNINEEQIKWLASQGMLIVNWNVDSLDWKGLTAEQIEANIMSHLTPGAIVLQHAAGGKDHDLSGTVKALPRIIEELNRQGIEMVTLDKLLDKPAYRK